MIKKSDFSSLANNYDKYRPDYSQEVLNKIIRILNYQLSDIDFLDIGAGTGIWTRMVEKLGLKSASAVEPNDSMRQIGKAYNSKIVWSKGTAEKTNLSDNKFHWISMASSFHWANFDEALTEFSRLLKPNGNLTLLWNPRVIEKGSTFQEIENYITHLNPQIVRQSSGLSGITEDLEVKILESKKFKNIKYIEGNHSIKMSKERYIGAWKSVNDVQYQLGSKFKDFIEFIEKMISADHVDIKYLTRSWTMEKK